MCMMGCPVVGTLAMKAYKAQKLHEKHSAKTPWFLVGNEGMKALYNSLKGYVYIYIYIYIYLFFYIYIYIYI